ncbi:MAG: hypothetical protein JWM86_1028, partial [Thermoleophilia bacterium]|nr:hypothetical protein [Thermoleophilia bacterium]
MTALGTGSAGGATAGTVVGATVPSATTFDPAGCAPLTAGRTDFGAVLPGQLAVTTQDCTIIFGSSNDTASLRLGQTDGLDRAMWAPPSGPTDPGFGTSGTTTTDLPNGAEHIWGAVEAADGTIYVAGASKNADASDQVTIGKYTAAGVLVPGFGTGGIKTINLDAGVSDFAWDIALQADGKPVLSVNAATSRILRLDATTGALDGTFGSGGSVSMPGGFVGKKIEVAPSGAIVATGTSYASTPTCMAVRVTSGGILDPSWGTGGVAQFGISGRDTACDGMAIQPDGLVVVAGRTNLVSSDNGSIVARFNAAGTALDNTFGTSGYRLADIPTNGDEFQEVALAADGSMIATGIPGAPGTHLTKLNSAGTIVWDRVDAAGPQTARDVVVLPDGRFMTSGNYGAANVARYSATGFLDTSFNNTGWRTLTAPTDLHENGGILLHDGRYLMAGSGSTGAWQLTVLSSTTIPDHAGGTADWSAGAAGMFGACLNTLGGGAVGTWNAVSGCAASNSVGWHAVQSTTETAAATPTGVTSA